MASSHEAIEAHEEEVNKIRSKVDKMEDEIYRDFCNQIGVSNIRCESMQQNSLNVCNFQA